MDNRLIYESYVTEREQVGGFTFPQKNHAGRRVPKLATIGDSRAAMDIVRLDASGTEIGYYEASIEWSWYGEHSAQTETSPGEEPYTEDLNVYEIIDRTSDTPVDITGDDSVYDPINEAIRGELDGESMSYFRDLGWGD